MSYSRILTEGPEFMAIDDGKTISVLIKSPNKTNKISM